MSYIKEQLEWAKQKEEERIATIKLRPSNEHHCVCANCMTYFSGDYLIAEERCIECGKTLRKRKIKTEPCE